MSVDLCGGRKAVHRSFMVFSKVSGVNVIIWIATIPVAVGNK